MQLDVSRFFSDRLVFDENLPEKLRVTNSFWDWCQRIISWIWSPSAYSEENRRTVACFKKYLIESLGEERLHRICARYSLDLDAMEKAGSALLSRDVAKIVIGIKSKMVGDADVSVPWEVPDIEGEITGRPSEWLARLIFDPFLADRERLQIVRGHPTDPLDVFMQNMAARVIKREMDVGTLIPAPNHSTTGKAQFYYVSAKIITDEGMVSYIFHPAEEGTDLEPMRLFRGVAARPSEAGALSSVISAFETDLGRGAYESGRPYDEIIRTRLGAPSLEAGHSLGSAIVQYRLANMDHIRKAYLFCGPGIPATEVEKFNEKNPKVDLVIFYSDKDRVVHAGEVHVGHKAPSNVEVRFCIHHHAGKENPHTSVPSKGSPYYGIHGGISEEERDAHFHHESRYQEYFRSTFGPPIACVLKKIRSAFGRAERDLGLTIGRIHNGKWLVEHFSAEEYTFQSCLNTTREP